MAPNQNRIDSILKMLAKEPEDEFLNYALGLEYAKDVPTHSLAEIQFKKVFSQIIKNPESMTFGIFY